VEAVKLTLADGSYARQRFLKPGCTLRRIDVVSFDTIYTVRGQRWLFATVIARTLCAVWPID